MIKSAFIYHTKIGNIGIEEDGMALTHLYFPGDRIPPEVTVRETPLLREAAEQLENYLAGDRNVFALPLAPAGTEFMHRVFGCLTAIPCGVTRTYLDIAKSIGNPAATRAVGLACRNNPLPVFIPCHRVIGSDGTLKGYRGGHFLKAYLLEHEKLF